MRAAIAIVALLSIAACEHPPARWIGIDRAAAACSCDGPDMWARHQTCIAAGRQYTCIRGDDGDSWQCAPLVVDVSAEARK